jgi:hypothetical protein
MSETSYDGMTVDDDLLAQIRIRDKEIAVLTEQNAAMRAALEEVRQLLRPGDSDYDWYGITQTIERALSSPAPSRLAKLEAVAKDMAGLIDHNCDGCIWRDDYREKCENRPDMQGPCPAWIVLSRFAELERGEG